MMSGELWVDLATLQRVTGWSGRKIQRLSTIGKLKWRKSRKQSKNGRFHREYSSLSISAEQQSNLSALLSLPGEDLVLTPDGAQGALPYVRPIVRHAGLEKRMKLIGPMIEFREGRLRAARLENGDKVSSLDDVAAWIGRQNGVCKRTIWSAYQKYLHGGCGALERKFRADRGQSHYFEDHPTAAAFLQVKFLTEGLSRQMSWEALVREWPKLEKEGVPPCYSTARTFLNGLPEPAKTLARKGPKAYENKCSPFILRGPVPAMEWWVSDHRQFDVQVRNTLFGEMSAEQAYRLWLTAIYDWGSRKIVGFCFAPMPNSRTINSALRLAVLSHGFPRNFYWDNGEDYKKVRRNLEVIAIAAETRTLLDGRGIGITSALPFHPRSKPIESWFSRWSKRFDVLWRPAYLGNKPGACPEFARAAQAKHALYLKGKRNDSPLPSDAEFILAATQWIDEHNQTRLDSLDHRTPNEVMEEQCPESGRPQINSRLLDVLFCERVKRVVQAGGCVQVDRMCYEPADASLFAMDMRQGRPVMVLRDPYNLADAVAADPETLEFIGELHIQQFVAQCPNGQITRDQIKAAMRRQRALKRGYAEYLATLSAIASKFGWQTERNALLERAGVRTGTDDARPLPAGVVPGARRAALPAPSLPANIAPTFVSDAVARDAGVFDEVDVEESNEISSPFVDDAVKRVKHLFTEEKS